MDKQTDYWYEEALKSFNAAKTLYNGGHFLEAAFFCHLSIEKMLKAFYAHRKKTIPPKIHNLLILAEKASLIDDIDQSQLDFIAELNTYQLEGRYPANRERLYQSVSGDDFKKIVDQTEVELSWLKQKLKSKQ